MFYGAPVWDPALIVAQIVTLQCLFYLSLGALLFLFVGPWVSHLALDHCLDDRYLNFHTFLGWMVTAANVANALVAAMCLVFVVGRAKKCLDFAATLYLLHLAAVSVLSAFPRSFAWWAVNIVGMVLAAVLGGLGRRGRPAAVEMVRPPTAAAAALARVQQAVGGTLQGVGGALHGLGLGNALQNLGAGGALQGLGAGRGAGGSSASPSLRGSGSGLKAIPEDIP